MCRYTYATYTRRPDGYEYFTYTVMRLFNNGHYRCKYFQPRQEYITRLVVPLLRSEDVVELSRLCVCKCSGWWVLKSDGELWCLIWMFESSNWFLRNFFFLWIKRRIYMFGLYIKPFGYWSCLVFWFERMFDVMFWKVFGSKIETIRNSAEEYL